MKKYLVLVTVLVTIFLLVSSVACAKPTTPTSTPTASLTTNPAPQKIVWKIQAGNPETHVQTKAIKKFVDQVAEQSKGRLALDLYPALGLGIKNPDVLSAVSKGIFESGDAVGGMVSGTFKLGETIELPGLMPYDVALRKKIGAALVPYLQKELDKMDVVLLGYSQAPPRNMFTKKEIKTLGDFKGLKIRSAGTVENSIVSQLGGTPVTIDLAEMYTALSQGLAQGVSTINAGVVSTKSYEQLKYVTILGWDGAAIMLTANGTAFRKLPPDLQGIMRDAGRTAYDWLWQAYADDDTTSLETLKKNGMIVLNPPPGAQDLIAKYGETYVDKEWLSTAPPVASEMLELIRKMVKDYKAGK